MTPGTSHHFGPFKLDAESRVLTRDGTIVPLAPRTFDLLLAFVTRNGRLLTKDELLRLVWGSDVHVEEASLAFQVSTLRKALGEHGSAWIETVPKHGYRFNATVETAAPPRRGDRRDTAAWRAGWTDSPDQPLGHRGSRRGARAHCSASGAPFHGGPAGRRPAARPCAERHPVDDAPRPGAAPQPVP